MVARKSIATTSRKATNIGKKKGTHTKMSKQKRKKEDVKGEKKRKAKKR